MSSVAKRKVTLRIMGHDYTLVTDQTEEKVQRIARYVDRQMRELAIMTRAAEGMIPILTCMTLTEQLMELQGENNMLRRAVEQQKVLQDT